MKDRLKIAVIANCQTQAISNYLRIITGCTDITNVPVHMFGSELYNKALERLSNVIDDENGVIFTFNLSQNFGVIQTSKLRERAKARVYSITNLYFSGFHPDITYLGGMGKRIHSPLGDLHSKVILTAFTEGLDSSSAVASFNSENYKRLGFFDEYQRSEQELHERDKLSDIRFASEFLDLVTQKPALYTMNHPIPEVLHKFSCKLCEHSGIPYSNYPPEFFNNYLSGAVWWPVYKEVAAFHGVSINYPMAFKQPDNKGGNILSLADFVELSYQEYEKIGLDVIRTAFKK
jgi:hypothetical protein